MSRAAETQQSLLPIIAPPPPPGRPGGDVLVERNDVEYVHMTVRSILNWVDGTNMSDVFSVNPYRGCEFGCAYCYARYTHEFLDLPDWEAFERRIFVKTEADRALRRDLTTSRDVRKYGITIGTGTDPYQPAEAKFGITRKILEALLPHSGIPISIITKGGLIERDADLLAELAKRHTIKVNFSCITTDRYLLRAIERRSPMAHVRFKAMKALSDRGIFCNLLIMPVLPGITDSEENLTDVLTQAKAAGAQSAAARALWLSSSSRKRFLPWLETEFPKLHKRYTEVYGGKGMYSPEAYQQALRVRFLKAKKRAGFEGSGEVRVTPT